MLGQPPLHLCATACGMDTAMQPCATARCRPWRGSVSPYSTNLLVMLAFVRLRRKRGAEAEVGACRCTCDSEPRRVAWPWSAAWQWLWPVCMHVCYIAKNDTRTQERQQQRHNHACMYVCMYVWVYDNTAVSTRILTGCAGPAVLSVYICTDNVHGFRQGMAGTTLEPILMIDMD